MTGYEINVLVLVVAGLGAPLFLASTGRPATRLVALELASGVATALFLVIAQISGLSYELVLPLVFVPISFAGVLVFTRLLSSRTED